MRAELAAWGRALGLAGPTAEEGGGAVGGTAVHVLASGVGIADLPPAVATAFGFGGWVTGDTAPITANAARGIPAVRRGLQVICSVMAQMPLQAVRESLPGDGRPGSPSVEAEVIRRDLLSQPEDGLTYATTIAGTVEHLLLSGVAWWIVTERDGVGFPTRVQHVAPGRVTISGGRVRVDAVAVPDRDVIRFDLPAGGLLHASGMTLPLAQDVQRTARSLARPTAPLTVLKDTRSADDEPLTAAEREVMLAGWEAARGRRAVAYVPPNVDVQTPTWNAATIGLSDAREQAAVDCARALNLDPRWVAAPSADSLTYSTTRESRSELVSITCAPIMLAIAQRLSMGDVTPRGQRVRFDTDAVLAGHARDRIDDATAAAGVAPMTRDEARQRHLGLPPAPEAPVAPPQRPAQTTEDPQMAGPTLLRLAAPQASKADPRVIEGLVIPWDEVANSEMGRVRFSAGSITWGDRNIPVLLDHDRAQPAGVVTAIAETDLGLSVTMRIDPGERGDDVLARLASGSRDGLSAGLELEPEVAEQMANRRTAAVNGLARLREVSFTAVPAFEGARATAPATAPAAANYSSTAVGTAHGVTALEAPVPTSLTLAAPSVITLSAPPSEPEVERIERTVERVETVNPAPTPDPTGGALQLAGSGSLSLAARPQNPYDRGEGSVILDLAASAMYGDSEARGRVQSLQSDALNLAVAVRAGYDETAEGLLVRPGYRQDLLLEPLAVRRPVTDAIQNRVTLTDATPFVIPGVGDFEQVGPHVEGTPHFAEGVLTMNTRTVTPRAISGAWRASRELLDSSSPAIDTIALNEMRRDYLDKSEAYAIAQMIAGVTATTTATGGANALEAAIRTFTDTNPVIPIGFAGNAVWNDLAGIKLANGEPRYPFINPTNRDGRQDGAFELNIMGARIIKVPGIAAREVVLVNPRDLIYGESPILTFRFDQPEGPGIIKLALWAYQAVAPLRGSTVRLSLTAV